MQCPTRLPMARLPSVAPGGFMEHERRGNVVGGSRPSALVSDLKTANHDRRRMTLADRLHIPDSTVRDQRRAADPRASAWVSANAGAGKTKVLTDRVVRLLLAGAAPGRLLCLTFTRTAAARM